jgi:hypothetical protein
MRGGSRMFLLWHRVSLSMWTLPSWCGPLLQKGAIRVGYKNDDACLAKVGDDEPIFVLRAQDISMVPTIYDWLDRNPSLNDAKRTEVVEHIDRILKWQESHLDRLKSAD